MKYWQPYGITDPNASYQNGDLVLGIDGSIPPGEAIEQTQREIVAVIQAAGLTPSGTDTTQLLKVFGVLTPKIALNPTLYVRTDGNDSNDGSANDSAHAFASISAAIAKAVTGYSLAGTTLTIQLGIAGTYAFPGIIPATSGTLLIRGNPSSPSTYILSGTGPVGGGSACLGPTGGSVRFDGVSLANSGTNNHTLGASSNGSATITNSIFSSINGNGSSHIFTSGGGSVTMGTGCTIAGSMGYTFFASGGSIGIASGSVVTVTGTPAFSGSFAFAQSCGTILVGGGSSFSGSATGTRYLAGLNGVINTFGGGANFFPGSVAGSTSSGGQYA